MYQTLRYEVEDQIAVLTINRPEALNALNGQVIGELEEAVSAVEADRSLKALIITGEGRSFVAGADIGAQAPLDVDGGRRWGQRGSALFRRIEKLEIPTIAAVNGFALGGGCELALACDIILASEKAKFGQPEVGLGITPGFSGTKANILITGETGVGKSVIAKTIHRLSNRSQGPFIEVNCAVLHENLIESELFGYEKGAFTGASSGGKIGKIELANHGTLFLDEIGELPLHVQSKLLQLIQEKVIERVSGNRRIALDFHLIAATNRNLEEDIQSGRFRSDLFYRLNVVRIHIPPLRERREEICPLAYRFLDRFSREYDKKKLTMSPRFLSFLEGYDWPGNVRQLENLMERMAIIAQHPVLDLDDLPAEFDTITPPAAPAPAGRSDTRSLSERMEDYEGEIIRDSYRRNRTTVAVARELGISQATAARKIAKYVAGYPERG